MTDKSLLNISTEIETYKPTPHMVVWLDTAIHSESEDISKIADECGIDRTNWYKWRKDPKFNEWFITEWNKRIKAVAWKLDAIGLRMAKRDYRYWEGMQRRVGNLLDPKTLQQINVNNQQNPIPILANLRDEQLDQAIKSGYRSLSFHLDEASSPTDGRSKDE